MPSVADVPQKCDGRPTVPCHQPRVDLITPHLVVKRREASNDDEPERDREGESSRVGSNGRPPEGPHAMWRAAMSPHGTVHDGPRTAPCRIHPSVERIVSDSMRF